jgi:predicted acetyltransferase
VAIRVRGIDDAEAPALLRVLSTAFGEDVTAEVEEDALAWAEVDRLVAADDGGRLVGSAGAYTFRMTVPGGAAIPVAGVTWVGVLPTHRRRGVLTSMMRFQLDDVAARSESVAVLTASEASIYPQFGYGLASRLAKVRIDTTRGLPLVSEPASGGRLRMVDSAEAEPHARRIHEQVQPLRVGELNRPDAWWAPFLRDRESSRNGGSARFWVLHEDAAGEVDGFAHYRIKEHWGDDDAVPRNEVMLHEAVAADPEVEAALLRFVAEVDLTAAVTSWHRPVDEAFRLRLADDRRYRVQLFHDHLFVRVLDVPAALAARRYEAGGTVVLGIDDAFRPSGSGRYRLDVADDGTATCERLGDLHDGDADVFLPVDALGSLYLGDVRVWQLAHAGRLRPSSPEALTAVERVFTASRAPYCTMNF